MLTIISTQWALDRLLGNRPADSTAAEPAQPPAWQGHQLGKGFLHFLIKQRKYHLFRTMAVGKGIVMGRQTFPEALKFSLGCTARGCQISEMYLDVETCS